MGGSTKSQKAGRLKTGGKIVKKPANYRHYVEK